MIEAIVPLLGIGISCAAIFVVVLLVQAIRKQNRPRRRTATFKANAKGKNYLGLFILLGGIFCYQLLLTSPQKSTSAPFRPAAALPSPPALGPGLIPVAFGNASPSRLSLIFTSSSAQYQIDLEPCPTCTVYTTTPPQMCPAETVYLPFALRPDHYKVDILTSGGHPRFDELNLVNVPSFKNCIFLTYSPDDRKMQEKQPY